MPMRALLNKFISIFRIELQDLAEDFNDLIEILEKRKTSQEITNYVYMGNKGVLLNEIASVEELLDSISKIDAYQYESVEDMIADVHQMIDKRIQERDFPAVVRDLVQRKFDKVCKYVMESHTS
jgi:ferritin